MRNLWSAFFLIVVGAGSAQADMTCVAAPYDTAVAQDARDAAALYAGIVPVLERFPAMAEAVASLQPAICLSDRMTDAHGYFEPTANRIVINRALPQALQTGVLLHELRHLWQSSQRACPTDELMMREYARATYAIEADASAISLMIAWDMKAHGAPDVWEALASWPQQADIAESFAKAMQETGDTALATTAAFYQWYGSEARRDDYYDAACNAYLDRQDESHLIPRYRMIGTEFFEELCRMPDGRAYRCADPREE